MARYGSSVSTAPKGQKEFELSAARGFTRHDVAQSEQEGADDANPLDGPVAFTNEDGGYASDFIISRTL